MGGNQEASNTLTLFTNVSDMASDIFVIIVGVDVGCRYHVTQHHAL